MKSQNFADEIVLSFSCAVAYEFITLSLFPNYSVIGFILSALVFLYSMNVFYFKGALDESEHKRRNAIANNRLRYKDFKLLPSDGNKGGKCRDRVWDHSSNYA